MKTAISIPDSLFDNVEEIAEELHISRSQLFADAVREYIEKVRNRKILESINAAYSEVETEEDTKIRSQGKRYYAGRNRDNKW